MAKYNTFLYGQELYGDSAVPTEENLLWAIQIDWDGNEFFDGANEIGRVTYVNIERGRDNYLAQTGRGFENYSPGKATLYLDNDDGRYDPYNVSSDLYPYVRPGVFARIGVYDKTTATYHELMRGKVQDLQSFNQGARKLIKLTIVDGQQYLAGRNIRLGYRRATTNPFYSIGTYYMWTYGKWADRILQASGWPSGEWPLTYDIDEDYQGWNTPGTTDNFFGWQEAGWFWDRDALQALYEVEQAEFGKFVHARNGEARFLSSHFTYDKIVELDEAELLRDISIPMPWDMLRNRVQLILSQINELTPGSAEVLYSMRGNGDTATYIFPGGRYIEFDVTFAYDRWSNIIPFNTAFVLDITTGQDGSGTDISASCSAEFVEPEFTEPLYADYGNGATIRIYNNTISSNAWVQEFSVNGQAYGVLSPSKINRIDDASKALFGERILDLTTPWIQDSEYAQTMAEFLLSRLKDPAQYPTIKLQNRPDKQFALDLYVDCIHLTSATRHINRLYRIGKITHEWLRETGQDVLTTVTLEPYFAVDAPIEIDEELVSAFATTAEDDCSGTPAAGKMEWCRTSGWLHQSGAGQDGEDGYVTCDLDNSSEYVLETTGLSWTIPATGILQFWHLWFQNTADPANSEAVYCEVTTTESGVIATEWIDFVQSVLGSWNDQNIDLSPWGGETVSQIRFVKSSAFNAANAAAYIAIDTVALGTLIGGQL